MTSRLAHFSFFLNLTRHHLIDTFLGPLSIADTPLFVFSFRLSLTFGRVPAVSSLTQVSLTKDQVPLNASRLPDLEASTDN